MFNRLLFFLLLGAVVWGFVQWVRHKRLSYLALVGTSIFLIGSLVTRHPLAYVGALAMMYVRWSLIAKERRPGASVPEKELHVTQQNPAVRQRELTALVSSFCDAEAGSRTATDAFDRLLVALAAETDKGILLKLVKQLNERGQLAALTAEFGKLPARSRRTIIDRFPVGQPTPEVTELYRVALRDEDSSVAGAARAIVRGEGFEKLRAEFEQPATALEGWTQLTIKTASAVVPCDGGGRLEIEPGDLNVRVRFEHLRASEIDNILVKLVLADSEGREWGLESYFQGRIFADDFEEDDRREALEKENAFAFWSDVPEAWGNALKERCLIAEAGELLDSRFYFDLRIGAQTLTLQMKYQGPKIDIAVLGSELVVRVSELYQVLYEGEGEKRELVDAAPVPPFAWLAPSNRLLCFAEPRCHYATLEQMDEVEPGEGEPSKAKRLESTGEPQPGVVFEQG